MSSLSCEVRVGVEREWRWDLLALREDNPRRVAVRREELSRIFDGQSGEGGDGGGELWAELGAAVLEFDEADDEGEADDDAENQAENEAHSCTVIWFSETKSGG